MVERLRGKFGRRTALQGHAVERAPVRIARRFAADAGDDEGRLVFRHVVHGQHFPRAAGQRLAAVGGIRGDEIELRPAAAFRDRQFAAQFGRGEDHRGGDRHHGLHRLMRDDLRRAGIGIGNVDGLLPVATLGPEHARLAVYPSHIRRRGIEDRFRRHLDRHDARLAAFHRRLHVHHEAACLRQLLGPRQRIGICEAARIEAVRRVLLGDREFLHPARVEPPAEQIATVGRPLAGDRHGRFLGAFAQDVGEFRDRAAIGLFPRAVGG